MRCVVHGSLAGHAAHGAFGGSAGGVVDQGDETGNGAHVHYPAAVSHLIQGVSAA